MQKLLFRGKALIVLTLMTMLLAGCGSNEKTKEAMKAIEDLDYQGALTLFDEAASLNENERLIARGRGIAYMGLTDYEQSILCFKDALAKSDGLVQSVDYDLNYYLAAAYTKEEDYSSAKDCYDAILALRPREKNAIFMRGQVKLGLKDIEGAKEDFEKIMAMEPTNYDRLISIFESLSHYGYEETGKEYLNNALVANEKKMNAYDIGRIYYYLGDYQKSYIALEEAKAKGSETSYLYLGKAYEATGDYNYAASVYSSYIAKEGGNARMYNQLGLCELNRGDYRKALEAFQQGLAMEDKGEIQQSLAFNEIVAYEYLGEYQEAHSKMKKYVKKYPDDAQAKRELDFLSTR